MKCSRGHDNVAEARFCSSCGVGLALESILGRTLGDRYRILERIGAGGMGVVYMAEQALGAATRKVAVKTLHAEFSREPTLVARFHREAAIIAQLEHPNTVRVYDFGSTPEGVLYIAMEYLAGEPLSSVLQRGGPLAQARTARILRQIGGSLDEAHRRGITHRDLKPDNVLLTRPGGEPDFVKLVDFGIAAHSEVGKSQPGRRLTEEGAMIGTPPYMSPEQFSGESQGRSSDIYSLGVMAYEMLAGRLPFEAQTPWQWANKHLSAEPLDFEATAQGRAVPAAVRNAVMRALAKDPLQRPATAGGLCAAIHHGILTRNSSAPARPSNEPEAAPPAVSEDAQGELPVPASEPAPANSVPRPTPSPAAVVLPPLLRPASALTRWLVAPALVAFLAALATGLVWLRSREPEPLRGLPLPAAAQGGERTPVPPAPPTPTPAPAPEPVEASSAVPTIAVERLPLLRDLPASAKSASGDPPKAAPVIAKVTPAAAATPAPTAPRLAPAAAPLPNANLLAKMREASRSHEGAAEPATKATAPDGNASEPAAATSTPNGTAGSTPALPRSSPPGNDVSPARPTAEELRSGIGYLTVDGSRPMTVIIDGERRGMTPLADIVIQPGMHGMVLRTEDRRVKRYRVSVKPGEHEKLWVRWNGD